MENNKISNSNPILSVFSFLFYYLIISNSTIAIICLKFDDNDTMIETFAIISAFNTFMLICQNRLLQIIAGICSLYSGVVLFIFGVSLIIIGTISNFNQITFGYGLLISAAGLTELATMYYLWYGVTKVERIKKRKKLLANAISRNDVSVNQGYEALV